MRDLPPKPANETLLQLQGGTLGYGSQVVLDGLDLSVNRGDFLAIVGPNGSGKTTLLRVLLGILPLLKGKVDRRASLGYAPQRGVLDPVFPLTAGEVVAMGLLGTRLVDHKLGADPPARRKSRVALRVHEALLACGLSDRQDAPFRDLSGGQKQRVLVARALVSRPDVLILDEPTNDLDLRGEHEVMELLLRLNQAGQTVVMVSHLLHVVARYAARIAFIHAGALRQGTTEEMLTPENLRALYGLEVLVGQTGGHPTVVALRPAGEGS